MIAPLGKLTPENTYILVTVTVPKNIEDFSVNLKAPVVINMDNRKGVQMIVEDDYPVKYKVYDVQKLVTNLFKSTTPKGSQSQDPFWDTSASMLLLVPLSRLS